MDPLMSFGGVKAAYYSAAFIIRSLAAEMLDTDPEEFDVSNVRQVELEDGQKAGEIVLSDHLANGAGFVAWLQQHWSDILRARRVRPSPPTRSSVRSSRRNTSPLATPPRTTACGSTGT